MQRKPAPVLSFVFGSALLVCLAVLGCGSGTSQSGSGSAGSGSAAATLSAASLNFGTVTAGQSSTAQTLTITDSGTALLALASVTLSDTTDYSLGNGCASTLSAGSDCSVSVTFKPQSAASLPATLTVTDSAAGSPQVVSLTGVGSAVPTPSVTLSASTLAFGTVTDGQASAAQSVTVTNTGTAALTISSVTLSDPVDYTLANGCAATLAAGSGCSLSLTFKPQTVGALAATLTLADNAGGSPQGVSLTGSGSAVPVPAVTLSASSLAFGTVTEGQTSASQGVTVSNTGSAALTLSAVTLSDTNDYALLNGCPATLAAAASCTLSVGFTPQSVASLPASITLADNAAASPQTVALSGTGSAVPVPALTVSPASLSFGSVTTGQSGAAQTVTLTDTGNAPLTLAGIVLSDPTNYTLASGCGGSLAAGAGCTLSLSFHPVTAGSLAASVTVMDNAAGSPQTIALSGTGTPPPAPVALVSPSALTFAAAAAGTISAPQTVAVSNTGSAPLLLSAILLGGSNPAAFTESSGCPASLAAGGSCSIAVTFTPSAASATYSASLMLTDNSGNTPGSVQAVGLSGSGAAPAPVAQAVVTPTSISFAGTQAGGFSAGQSVTLSNPGNALLTGIALSLSGANAASFSQSSNCGGTLAAGTNCTITVAFAPFAAGPFAASLNIADSASGSPQTVSLSGTGTAPQATLSPAALTFPSTTDGTTSAALSATLTNPGTAPLSIASLVLGGTSAAAFSEATTCASTLAAGASCSISVTFSPTGVQTYGATVTLTDNAAGSPQTLALSGTGTAPTVTRTLLVEPDQGISTLYTMVNGAQKTIDMTMYELVDTTFSGDLVAACNRGVRVRVILDQNLERSNNTAAYNQLNAAAPNCTAVFANTSFQATHQKSFIVDGGQVAIMTLNLTSRYYTTTRDFAVIENDPNDIAAIQATFNEDYSNAATSPYPAYTPPLGDDLIWSPTTAQAALLGVINNATKTLLVENEEMGAANIVSALEQACQRGVAVSITLTDGGNTTYEANFRALEQAGCGVHTYADNATTLYIHAKAMVADYGLPTQAVYVGSINFSIASMTENRELGLYVSDPTVVQTLKTTLTNDYAGAPPY